MIDSFQIVFTALCVIGAWLVMRKNRWGWICWNISNIFIITIFCVKNLYISILPYLLYTVINSLAFIKWSRGK